MEVFRRQPAAAGNAGGEGGQALTQAPGQIQSDKKPHARAKPPASLVRGSETILPKPLRGSIEPAHTPCSADGEEAGSGAGAETRKAAPHLNRQMGEQGRSR
ncbi:hypothetical protein AcidC75_26040 [Acidisoma sp. C75]